LPRRELLRVAAASAVVFAGSARCDPANLDCRLDEVQVALITRWVRTRLVGRDIVHGGRRRAPRRSRALPDAPLRALPGRASAAPRRAAGSAGDQREPGLHLHRHRRRARRHALAGIWGALDRWSDGRIALLLGTALLGVVLVILPYDRTVVPTASDEPHYLIIMQSLVLDHDLNLANDYAGDALFRLLSREAADIHGIVVGNAIYSIATLGSHWSASFRSRPPDGPGCSAMLCVVGCAPRCAAFPLAPGPALRPPHRLPRGRRDRVRPSDPHLHDAGLPGPRRSACLRHRRPPPSARRAHVGAGPRARKRAHWDAAVALDARVVRRGRARFGHRVRRAVAAARSCPAHRRRRGAVPRARARALVSQLAPVRPVHAAAGYYLLKDFQPVLVYTPWIGGTGLFFDGTFGLIPRAAIYLLAFVGVAALWRRARREHGAEIWSLALPWALTFVYIASIAYWYADGAPASRYMLADASAPRRVCRRRDRDPRHGPARTRRARWVRVGPRVVVGVRDVRDGRAAGPAL